MSWLRNRALRRQAVADQVAAELRGEAFQPRDQALCAAPTWRDRALAWLFPRPVLADMPEMDGLVPGYLETHVITHFDWKDRLRILVAGRHHVCLRTKTDEGIARSYSLATTWVEFGPKT